MALAGVIMVAILSLTFFSARSFAALTNYVDLDNVSRNTLDIMLREIRQAEELTFYSNTQLTFRHVDPISNSSFNVSYIYSPSARTLTRIQGSMQKILLRECDFLRFAIYQRNPLPGTWDQYPTATVSTCKLVQLSWICSRTILGARVNTESVQSAKVVIRKK
jgi:hypothetical protein